MYDAVRASSQYECTPSVDAPKRYHDLFRRALSREDHGDLVKGDRCLSGFKALPQYHSKFRQVQASSTRSARYLFLLSSQANKGRVPRIPANGRQC